MQDSIGRENKKDHTKWCSPLAPPVGLEPTTCGLTGPNFRKFVLSFSVFLLFIRYFNAKGFISCIFITSFIMRFLINGQITAKITLYMLVIIFDYLTICIEKPTILPEAVTSTGTNLLKSRLAWMHVIPGCLSKLGI